ncbi:MAG: glyceraldehyde-3-phosphate dehydrogenase [Pseudomonadales bacterium]|nr:glyceraldehyde-3-phosphate dehydrogenase [Pseudomonadales bacterium]
MSKIRIGLMGLGHIGRQIYQLATQDERFELVAISDIGKPEILCHLLNKSMGQTGNVKLVNNFLLNNDCRTRLLSADHPTEIPWDVFDIDFVIDATGRFRSVEELTPHLTNGAKRVVCSTLPQHTSDRVVLFGVNEHEIQASDRIISAGSASTTATALALNIIAKQFEIRHASMTSVHAYTSDQSLQDYAGADYRRSRSGAENIIPNSTPALHWIQKALPSVDGKMTGFALNVPVQLGSMLDLNVALADKVVSLDEIRELYVAAASATPRLLATTNEPIVSSDVKTSPHSLLVDLLGCMKAGTSLVKIMGWHSSLGHAHRILDVLTSYTELDSSGIDNSEISEAVA